MITAIVTRSDKFPIPSVISQVLGQMREEHTKLLAEEHKKELDKAIDDSVGATGRIQKPTGLHLKDQIEVEKLNVAELQGYGVGNVAVLNQKAPWWIWINFGRALSGRTVPPGTDEDSAIQGHFEPSAKGIFTKGSPKFPIFPKKAIVPHNYIEKALGVMIGKARQLLKF
jgi:hypothetical protein